MKEFYDDNLYRYGHVDPTIRYQYIMWDGLLDRKTGKYLEPHEIEKLCNRTDFGSRTWERKYDEMKAKNELLKQRIEYLEGLLRKHNLEGFK